MSSRTVTIILILLALASIPIYWLRLAFTIIPIRDGLYLSTVFVAVIASFFAVYKYGFKHSRSFTLIMISVALVCTFIEELIFEYHYIILRHDIPFPSIADFFSLMFYTCFFIGLMNELRVSRLSWKKVNKKLLALVIVISLILIAVVSYYGVYQSYDPTVNLFTNLVAMGYGVGDLLMIIVCLFLVIMVKEYSGGRLAKIWLLMLTGFLFYVVADITWNFYETQYHDEVWFYKSLLDTLWMLGYLSWAQGLFLFGFSIDDAAKLIGIDMSKNSKPLVINNFPAASPASTNSPAIGTATSIPSASPTGNDPSVNPLPAVGTSASVPSENSPSANNTTDNNPATITPPDVNTPSDNPPTDKHS